MLFKLNRDVSAMEVSHMEREGVGGFQRKEERNPVCQRKCGWKKIEREKGNITLF